VAGNIAEFFGYEPGDSRPEAVASRASRHCPFLDDTCAKTHNDGEPAGGCSIKPKTSPAVIACPYRLYGEGYRVLGDVAEAAFGPGMQLYSGSAAKRYAAAGYSVAVFGRRWGGELRLPARGGRGGYFVDWILAHLATDGTLRDFVAVEVQTIDTTGSYRGERDAYLRGDPFPGTSTVGLNWENVYKRILPQLIYKGHVLRREGLCSKGLFFVCPEQVFNQISGRAGGNWLAYTAQPGSVTFQYYGLGVGQAPNGTRLLELRGRFTTTIDQLALALSAPSNLPPAGVYKGAIEQALQD
jgi:hypothetical protein